MGVCVLQATLAYESIVLYMCEGKVLMDIHSYKRKVELSCFLLSLVSGTLHHVSSSERFAQVCLDDNLATEICKRMWSRWDVRSVTRFIFTKN